MSSASFQYRRAGSVSPLGLGQRLLEAVHRLGAVRQVQVYPAQAVERFGFTVPVADPAQGGHAARSPPQAPAYARVTASDGTARPPAAVDSEAIE
jgi:hypothetical protein